MTEQVLLPHADGSLAPYAPGRHVPLDEPPGPPRSRIAYAAAHVVADPLADIDPTSRAALDWEATMAYRRHLWSLGLSLAEAMDTAQREMGLDWETTKDLIRRSVAEASSHDAEIACGAGTDHLQPADAILEDVKAAYEEQCEFVEGEGSRIILMASRALAAVAEKPEEYAEAYGSILTQVSNPVILHWLGGMFDPALEGYWGHRDLDDAMEVCLSVIDDHAGKVDGIKVSLLDKEREVKMRRRLPEEVKMYTGDDFNYTELIRGDEEGFSHALLGIFDAIAPAAAAALAALDAGDTERYEEILAPTVPLSRHIFKAPTQYYKAGLLLDGERAAERMRRVLAVAGVV